MLLMPTMSETEKMNVDERRKYIHKMWKRYREGEKPFIGRDRSGDGITPEIDHPHDQWSAVAEETNS
jgi:hypothetical protein